MFCFTCNLHGVSVTSEEALRIGVVGFVVVAAVTVFTAFLLAYTRIAASYSLMLINCPTACKRHCMQNDASLYVYYRGSWHKFTA